MALGGGAAASDIDVAISGDSSGLNSALGGAIDRLGDFRTAVGLAGGIIATFAAKQVASAISAASDFETAMADVEKVTSPETMRGMREEIMEMASRIPLAHDELGELAAQAGRMGAEGVEEVSAFTEAAASMGAATVLSASDAGTALGKLATAVDEPLGAVGSLGDAINEVSNNFATDSEEIIDSAQRSGQALSTLGMESDSIIGLSAAFNEVSPTSRIAATRMQAVGEAMMDPSNVQMFADAIGVTSDEFVTMREESPEDTMLEIMDSVDEGRLSFDEMSSQLTKETARAFRDTAGAGDQMREAMEMSGKAMKEGGSLANELAVETDTAAGQWKLFKNRLQNVAIQIGDNLLPYVRDLLAVLSDGLAWFERINSATDGWAGTIALLVGVIGGAIAAGGALLSMLGGVAAITGALTVGFTGVAGAIAAVSAPVWLVVAALAALGYAYKTNLFGFRDAVHSVVEAVKPTLAAVGDSFRTLATRIQEAIGTIRDKVIQPFLAWVVPIWQKHFSAIADELKKTIGVWIDTIRGFVEFIKPYVSAFLDALTAWWSDHGDQVMAIVQPLLDGLKKLFEVSFSILTDIIVGFIRLARGDFEGFKESLLSIVDTLVTAVVDLFKWLYKTLIGGSIIPDLVGDILGAFESFGSDLLGWLSGMVEDFISDVTSFAGDVVGEFESMGQDALDAITSIDFAGAGKDAVSDLASGIRDKIPDVASAAESVASSVRDKLPGSDAEEGPLSDITDAGPALSESVAEGMTDRLRELERAATKVASAAHPDLAAPVPSTTGGTRGRTANTYDIDVTIEGDASRRDVKHGVSDALRAANARR